MWPIPTAGFSAKRNAKPDEMKNDADQPSTVFDELEDLTLFREMAAFFGLRRFMELVGWAVLWGVMGIESVNDLRKELEAQGLSKSATYRAAADFKRLRVYLEEKYQRPVAISEAIWTVSKIGIPS